MKRNVLFIILNIFSVYGTTQSISKDVLTKRWNAYWIAAPNSTPKDYGVYHFRKTFSLPNTPASFIVHVSADNRYKFL